MRDARVDKVMTHPLGRQRSSTSAFESPRDPRAKGRLMRPPSEDALFPMALYELL